MKKILLALLISTGITSAYAQSSVNVYGIIDVGVMGTKYTGTGTSAKTNQNQTFIGQSGETPSRLGFRGTEDLGGGTSALFTVETGLQPASATASTFNNRQSFVGIKQNGVGTLTLGTQYTPVWAAVMATDAAKGPTAIGDVIYTSTFQSMGNPGTATYANTSSSGGASDSFTVRTSNTAIFASEDYKGLSGTAMVTANNQTNNAATNGGVTNAQGWGLSAKYVWEKLLVTAAYQSLKSQNPGTLTSPAPALWTNASGGINTQDNQKYVGATYDFGIVKTYVQWINRKAVDTLNTNYFADRTAQQIGVTGNFTPNIDGWASVGNGRITAFGASQPTANFVGYQVGSNYWLSKRTNFYALYGQNNTSSVSASAGAVGGSNYAVGVRHTF